MRLDRAPALRYDSRSAGQVAPGPAGGWRIFFELRDVQFSRARALEKKSEWEQAARLYRRILERNSSDLGARLRLARVEERLGVDADRRLAFLEETVRLWPDSGGARYLLACALSNDSAAGSVAPRVVKLLEEAVERSPDLADAYLRLSRALQASDPGNAFRYFAAYQERARQGALRRRDAESGLGDRIRATTWLWRIALGVAALLALGLVAWAVWHAGGANHAGPWPSLPGPARSA